MPILRLASGGALLSAAVLLALPLLTERAAATFPGTNGLIAFDGSLRAGHPTKGGQLFTVRPDGSGLAQLTHTRANVENASPSFSADGKRIVFVRATYGRFKCGRATLTGGPTSVVVMNADGSGVHQVLRPSPCSQVILGDPSFSPDGRTVVFDALNELPGGAWHTEKQHESEIFAMNADGTHVRRLTFTASVKTRVGPAGLGEVTKQVGNFTPAFSPDGRTIVFEHSISRLGCVSEPCTVDIYELDLKTRQVHRLTHDGASSGASFSPGGKRIVFTSGRDYAGQVAGRHVSVMDAGGQGRQTICSIDSSGCIGCATMTVQRQIGHCQRFSQAVFSPDGSRIAFLVETVDYQTRVPARLVAINPDGSQPATGPPIQVFSTDGGTYSLSWQSAR